MTEDGGLSVAGWRVWYGNGSVLTSLDMEWDAAPAADVQMVTVYFDRTYRIWVDDRWENQNYVRELHSADYYWRAGPAERSRQGRSRDVLPGVARTLLVRFRTAYGALMYAKAGSFTCPASAATDTVVSGLGFTPKAIIFLTSGLTAEGYRANAEMCLGFTAGPAAGQNAYQYSRAIDNVSTTDNSTAGATGLCIRAIAGTMAGLLKSFDTDGFTIDWTGYASSFKPDFAIFLLDDGVGASGGHFSCGVAKSPTERWAYGHSGRHLATMTASIDANRNQRADRCILEVGVAGTNEFAADLVSFDATPGFTLNWITVTTFSPQPLFRALLLKGGSYAVGNNAKPTGAATANQDISGFGFNPAAVFLFAFGLAANTAVVADAEFSAGFSDGTNHLADWQESRDALLPTEANSSQITGQALRLATGPSTTDAQCNASLTAVVGGIRLPWTTNNAVASQICYAAFGPLDAGPFPPWLNRVFKKAA